MKNISLFDLNKTLIILGLLINSNIFSQSIYEKYVDSAVIYCNENPKLAKFFLKKIPKPLEKSIPGNLAKYYQVNAISSNNMNDRSMGFYNYFLALKYAEKEKKYDIAGMVSVELYSNIYWDSKDTASAKKYLALAKEYYIKDHNQVKLLEVSQLYAYEKYVNNDYTSCRNIILKDLSKYRFYGKKDSYSLLFGLALLISSELQIDKYTDAYKHYYEFKKLKGAPGVEDSVFETFYVGLQTHFAQMHCKNNQLDSTVFYLNKVERNNKDINFSTLQRYFTINIELYKKLGSVEKSKLYVDSLTILQNSQIKKNLQANYLINKALIEYEDQNKAESERKILYVFLIVFIIVLLIALISHYFRKQKRAFKEKNAFSQQNKSLEQTNHQLSVKINEMEFYVKNLKTDLKKISEIQEKDQQDIYIQDFYRKLHVDASQIFNNPLQQLALINQLNSEFAPKLKSHFSSLDNLDIIICHYVYSGLINKEIAVFLNTTIRSVESKRYRISKKMGLVERNLKLSDFLKQFFD